MRIRLGLRHVTAQLMVALLLGTLLTGAVTVRASAAGDPCAPTASPVACENTLPGSPATQWDIEGAGDVSIQGYATDMSVNHGTTVDFKINTDAAAYSIDIYRIGYYQGNGARLVASIAPSAALPQQQPACLFDGSTGLTDCANWAVSASWAVPATAVSGVYVAKLERSDTGGASHIVFIVRDDEGHSGLVYQTSDPTWQAYNRYGGYSLYYGSPGRAYKVSYNRPFLTRDCCDETFLFSAEYPMIRWLEANGYDVSYISGVDTERAGSRLLNHKAFLSSGHDEYWSAGQRANVEAARDAGVSLAFFSGNEMFWKTRWEPSLDASATPYRTLVTYKETYASTRIDPADPPTWTGTWRDTRFSPPADGGRPENALTGQLFMVNCCSGSNDQDFAITVPQSYAALRLWRNTAIASLPAGGVYTFPAGTLGYEWDEDVDNGSRPAGLFHLSSTTENVSQRLQDFGNTYAPGTAVHHLTMYRASSGALVFGAGTIRWSWGLDGTHDGGASTVDVNLQQATVNLFADMGAQPTTLRPGLVAAAASTDTVAPTSTVVSPSASATLIADQPSTVAGTAADAGGVVGGVEVSTDGGTTWHPATGTTSWSYTWTPNRVGSTTIKTRAVDDSGNLQTPGAGVAVTVTRVCPCSVWPATAIPTTTASSDGAPNEVGVKVNFDVAGTVSGVRFYKGTTNTGTHVGHLWSRTGTLLATATFTNETASGWQQVNFSPPVAVAAGTTYVASYFAPAGHYAQSLSYFTTSGVSTPPVNALKSGVDGANGVYRYNASGFPNVAAYQNSNYWVDVVYTPSPPAAPSGVAATALSATQIRVSWNAVTGANGFKVQRSPDGTTWSTLATPAQGAVSYTDTGLLPSTLYYYRVIANNIGGASAPSATVSALTAAAVPPAPTGLSAVGTSASSMSLVWTNVGMATGYQIQRAPAGSTSWAVVATTSSNTAAYTDTGLAAGTSYDYRVLALNSTGASAPSASTTGTTLSGTPPPPPSGLTATAVSSTEIVLSWTDVAGETGYALQRSFDGVNGWTGLDAVDADVTMYADAEDITSSTTYFYRVVAVNAGGSSAPSNVVSATTLVNPPASPVGVQATALSSSSIAVSWQDVTGSTGFTVLRSAGANAWVTAGSTGKGVLGFTDVGLLGSTTYGYRVVAVNAGGASPPSAVASATTLLAPPAAPASPTATPVSQTEIDLSWSDVAHASGFTVQAAAGGSSTWSTIGTTAAGTLTYKHTGLAPSSTWSYRVIASNAAGSSPPSGVATATTLPNPPGSPTGVTATPASATQITVAWADSPGATSFDVQRSTDGESWTLVGTTSAGVLTFTNGGLSPSSSYSYRVLASNIGGTSTPSAAATATTMPAAPQSVVATAVASDEIDVTWQQVTGASGYRVERSTDGTSGWTQVCAPTVLTCTTSDLLAATTYYFRVFADGAGGSSAPSSVVSVTTLPADTAPPAPTGATATADSQSEITVTWDDVAGATGFVVERSHDGVTGWVVVGTTAPGVTTFSNSGLDADTTYWYQVIATGDGGNSAPSTVASATTLAAPPATPTNVVAQAAGSTAIHLTWDPVAGATSYVVDRAPGGTTDWSPVLVTTDLSGSYTDGGLEPLTSYSYRVTAQSSGGPSSPSAAATATTSAPPPARPLDVAAQPASSTSIRVTWASQPAATAFTVQRSVDGFTWISVGAAAAGATELVDTGLAPSTTYLYQVIASNDGGASDPSAVASASTFPLPPSAPSGLAASASSGTAIAVSWSDVTGETNFAVERSPDGTTGWAVVGSTGQDVTTFQDNGLAPATTYYYRVKALNAGGASAPSGIASATTAQAPPAPPTGVTAHATSSTSVQLAWDDVAGETGFNVQRSPNGTTGWTTVGSAGAAVLSFTDTNLASSTTYWYRVIAIGPGGSSAPSGVVSATTPVPPPPPPSGVTAQALSATGIRVTWSASPGATTYVVQRSLDGATGWVTAGTTASSPFDDAGLTANTIYYYAVVASDVSGSSAPSAVASATTFPPAPSAPTGLAVTSSSTTQVALRWNDVAGETSFSVQRSASPGGAWAPVGSTGAGVTTFTDATVAANTTYSYQVLAVNSGGSSAGSNVVSVTTPGLPPTSPTDLKAFALSSSSIALSWVDSTAGNPATAASGFTVQRSPSGTTGWVTVGTVGAGTLTYTDGAAGGLAPNTAYFYRVLATNSGGTSAPSTTATATTEVTACPCQIWPSTAVPAVAASADASANELGVKFRADVNGFITGIRFYKGATNTGTHTGRLWSRTGTQLASVTFTNETATGWQQATFSSPVAVTAGTTYVASYFAPSGHYSQDVSYFTASGAGGAPVRALQAAVDGANGVYRYGSTGFPNVAGYSSSNYWVDVVFSQAAPAAPTGLAAVAASSSRVNLSWTASASATSYRIERSPDGVGGWVQVGSSTGASFADTGLAPSTTYVYRVRAVGFGGASPPSATASATTPGT